MNFNVTEIREQLSIGFQITLEQCGKLSNHSVRIIKEALEPIKHDLRLAGAIVVVANIVFFEIALRLTKLSDKLFSKYVNSEENCKNIFALTLFSSLMIGINVGLSKGLQLSPLVTAGISTATVFSYILFKFCIAPDKDDKSKKI